MLINGHRYVYTIEDDHDRNTATENLDNKLKRDEGHKSDRWLIIAITSSATNEHAASITTTSLSFSVGRNDFQMILPLVSCSFSQMLPKFTNHSGARPYFAI